MTALSERSADPARGLSALRARVLAYVALTKPRIIELLLVTTVPAMMLAARGWPSWRLLIATLVGGTLAAGAANVFNCWYDRDIDRLMHRTERRPLPTGLAQAVDLLESEGDVFRQAFGSSFVDFVVAIKRHELGRYNAHVTDWEQREYFEVY